MGDENEEVTMILAAETARHRRYDEVRRRARHPGEDKTTQTDPMANTDTPPQHSSLLIHRGITLLSYMAFSLVIGTLCLFKLFITMETDHSNYIYVLVSLILTLVLQCMIAYILLYISKWEPVEIDTTLTFIYSLTGLIATVTFINMVVFIIV